MSNWEIINNSQLCVLGMQFESSVLGPRYAVWKLILGLGYGTCMKIIAFTILKMAIYEDLVVHVFCFFKAQHKRKGVVN